MKYFDAHSHLYMAQFDADRAEVLARMQALGVGSIVIGTNYKESKQALALAKQYDFLWASVGLHPNDAEVFDVDKYEELAKDPKVVAIGECGLDYFRSSGEGQHERFVAQIDLAHRLNKPLIIHCRDAHDDCSDVLQNYGIAVPVVMHFFTGTAELAQKYLDLGCYLSFPGPITYTDHRSMRDPANGGGMYDDSIRVAPVDKILAETDSPFAAPAPHRGKRNEPAYVAEVVKKLATIKGMDVDTLAQQILTNAKKVFALGMLFGVLMAPSISAAQIMQTVPVEEPVVELTAVAYAAQPPLWEKVSSVAGSMAANAVSGTSRVWTEWANWLEAFFGPEE